MKKVLGVMTWPMAWVKCHAISRERWRDLEKAFGTKMEVLSRDTGGKCQPCRVEL